MTLQRPPLVEEYGVLDDAPAMSRREVEVLHLLILGHTSFGVGVALGLSRHTVRAHICSIYRKLHVSSRGQLAASAIAYGVISVHEVRMLLNIPEIAAVTGVIGQSDDCFVQDNLRG